MCRKKKTSQTFQPQVGLSSTELSFFLFKSLLNLSPMQNLLVPQGQLQEKNGHLIREKKSSSEVCRVGYGQVYGIWPVVISGRSFCTIWWFLCRFQWNTCGCRCCFVTFSPAPLHAPAWACFPCAFQSWQEALESGGCLFWNVLEGVNFSRDTSHFPACILAPAQLGLQSSGVDFGGWPLKEIKDQPEIHGFLHIFLNILLRCF